MGSLRINQVNSVIVNLVGEALKRAFSAPGVLATVTKAQVTPDLREATVWISLLPESEESWQLVEAALPELQRALAENLETKRTPKLRVRQDHGPGDAARIESLLRNEG